MSGFLQGVGVALNAGKDIERRDRQDRMAAMEESDARRRQSLMKIRQAAIIEMLRRQQERESGAQGGAKFGGLYDDAKNGGDLPSVFGEPVRPTTSLDEMLLLGLAPRAEPAIGLRMRGGQGLVPPPGFSDGGPVRVPASAPVGVVATPPGTAGFSPAAGAMPPWIQGYRDGGPVRDLRMMRVDQMTGAPPAPAYPEPQAGSTGGLPMDEVMARFRGVPVEAVRAERERKLQDALRKRGEVRGPGTGTSDSIPARLSDGEYVIPAEVVRRKGTDFFDKLLNERKK